MFHHIKHLNAKFITELDERYHKIKYYKKEMRDTIKFTAKFVTIDTTTPP